MDLVEEAQDALMGNDLEKAERLCQEALEKDEDDVLALQTLCMAQEQGEKWSEALDTAASWAAAGGSPVTALAALIRTSFFAKSLPTLDAALESLADAGSDVPSAMFEKARAFHAMLLLGKVEIPKQTLESRSFDLPSALLDPNVDEEFEDGDEALEEAWRVDGEGRGGIMSESDGVLAVSAAGGGGGGTERTKASGGAMLQMMVESDDELKAMIFAMSGTESLDAIESAQWEEMATQLGLDVGGMESDDSDEFEVAIWRGFRLVCQGIRERKIGVATKGIARLRIEAARGLGIDSLPTARSSSIFALGLLLASAILTSKTFPKLYTLSDIHTDLSSAETTALGSSDLDTADPTHKAIRWALHQATNPSESISPPPEFSSAPAPLRIIFTK